MSLWRNIFRTSRGEVERRVGCLQLDEGRGEEGDKALELCRHALRTQAAYCLECDVAYAAYMRSKFKIQHPLDHESVIHFLMD